MTLTNAERIECLKLAVAVTTRNKTEAMIVAKEFIDFVEQDKGEKNTTDKQDTRKPRSRPVKTAGKTADSEKP